MQTSPLHQRWYLGIAVITVGLIAFHYLGLLAPIERLVTLSLKPVGRSVISLLTRIRQPGEASDRQLRQEMRELEQRVAELSVENVELRSSLDAALDLTDQRTFLKSKRLAGISGRIFGRSPEPTARFVVVDIGTKDGVRIGAPAIIHDGIVIGVITEATEDTSHILLSVDNRSSFAGMVAERTAAEGVVTGVRGLSLRMDLIPQSEEVKPGQLVVTSGTDPTIAAHLLLGEIERVEKQPGAVIQSASLRPLYSVTELDAVTIVTTNIP